MEDYKDPINGFVWTKIVITDWLFKKADILNLFQPLTQASLMFIEGDRSFDINWSSLRKIKYDRIGFCFYCKEELVDNKTKDHVVPKSFLKAIGIISYPNNLVDCCKKCNSLKSNFSLPQFKMILESRIKRGEDAYEDELKMRVAIETIKKIHYEHSKGSKGVFKREFH